MRVSGDLWPILYATASRDDVVVSYLCAFVSLMRVLSNRTSFGLDSLPLSSRRHLETTDRTVDGANVQRHLATIRIVVAQKFLSSKNKFHRVDREKFFSVIKFLLSAAQKILFLGQLLVVNMMFLMIFSMAG